ncbi:hypothetical protein EZJ43_10870 [Pedobacter changchengzhani]|uniref:Uncharacterized protein n=1 Tax=Pedobacter changchengzhani TaxID=2529274 RepID=A0A4R5MJR2_9SPHI|nr:hypothetical protein [Pedobacter changchengzhani]TDG35850.1 hypothetical protein EZJ43_10870 [Pedobacter changchengzhani]
MDRDIKSQIVQHVNWREDVLSELVKSCIDFHLENNSTSRIFLTKSIVIILLDIGTDFLPENLIQIQKENQLKNIKTIYLWEDVWLTKPILVISRLRSLCGMNIRVHGRKTKVVKIIKPLADLFLDENHLQGAVSSRYKLGLFFKDELIAVATFSALRKMNHTENYKSVELIRFVVKMGYSVIGGLSKLIKAFYLSFGPNDVMTYADRDWSVGEGYLKLGFECTSILEPHYFLLDKNFSRQLSRIVITQEENTVFNTGSLKFVLKF